MHSVREIKDNPSLVIPEIGKNLNQGSLILSVGAGISMDFGLPSWDELLTRILTNSDQIDVDVRDISLDDKTRLLDKADDGSLSYVRAIHKALYETIPTDLELKFLQKAPGLLAIAALCIGSRRGRIDHIFTYNFDDLLERYLKLLGLSVFTTDNYSEIHKSSDVRLDHVHGYIPTKVNNCSKPKRVILSQDSIENRLASISDDVGSWMAAQSAGKICLYLGSSGDDSLLRIHVKKNKLLRIQNEVDRANSYHGYAILTPNAYSKNSEMFAKAGVAPILLDDTQIPNFVMKCCQHASDLSEG